MKTLLSPCSRKSSQISKPPIDRKICNLICSRNFRKALHIALSGGINAQWHCTAPMQGVKVSYSQKKFFLSLNTPENQRNFLQIYALASESGQIKKIKVLYYVK